MVLVAIRVRLLVDQLVAEPWDMLADPEPDQLPLIAQLLLES